MFKTVIASLLGLLQPSMMPSRGHSGAAQADSTEYDKVLSRTVNFTPASTAAAVCAEQAVTVPGVLVGDHVMVNPPSSGNACKAGAARISATDTVQVNFINPTAGALTHAAGNFDFIIFRKATKA